MRFHFLNEVGETDIVLPEQMRHLIVKEKIVLQFGAWKRNVNVIFSNEMGVNEIGVHKDLLKPYSVPADIDFKYKIEDQTFRIGPIICFVFFNKEKSLTRNKLKSHIKYAAKYKKIGGLFILSALDSIDLNNKTIKGYYYDPNGTEKWKYGIFPFPEVVFRRCNARVIEMKELSIATNGKVFNYPIMDKWELYNKLKRFPDVLKYFPETIKSKRIKDLNLMLKKYGSVYLKPAKGSLAKGIYKVQGSKGQYVFKNRRKESIVKSTSEMRKFLRKLSRIYLMQQSIMDQLQGERNIVLRVIMQKDSNKEWGCSGLYARIGLEGSIVTNRHLTDSFLRVEEAFIRHYGLSSAQGTELRDQMLQVCKQVCKAMDQLDGHYADIGFDVMIGSDLRIWIIEANNRAHNHLSPLKTIKDVHMYNQLAMKPLEYAGALADY